MSPVGVGPGGFSQWQRGVFPVAAEKICKDIRHAVKPLWECFVAGAELAMVWRSGTDNYTLERSSTMSQSAWNSLSGSFERTNFEVTKWRVSKGTRLYRKSSAFLGSPAT